MTGPNIPQGGWLIHKAGRGWYRPNAQGYTSDTSQAGRFSHKDAMKHSHPNGPNGPRDGITIKHECEVQEYIRRDRDVIAALPEVQALIRQAVEAEREACARMVDCGCDAAKKAAVLRAANGMERYRACGEYACGADDAAAIRKRGEG